MAIWWTTGPTALADITFPVSRAVDQWCNYYAFQCNLPYTPVFLSPIVHMHGGLICIAFRLSGRHWIKNQTRKKFIS